MNNLLFLGNLGAGEIIVIALIVLLLFGGKKIPELMKGLGKGVRSFKEGVNNIEKDIEIRLHRSQRQAQHSGRRHRRPRRGRPAGNGEPEHHRTLRRGLEVRRPRLQALSRSQEIQRLPPHVRRAAQVGRCGDGGHGRPHARDHRRRGHDRRQARLCREAADALGVRVAPADQAGRQAQDRHADG